MQVFELELFPDDSFLTHMPQNLDRSCQMFVFKRSCWSEVPVVSQCVKAGCASALTASQSLLKKAFCRTRHKPRLWNNNKSTPYAHFIKHCITELRGPVSWALAKMHAHNFMMWRDDNGRLTFSLSVIRNEWSFCKYLCCLQAHACWLWWYSTEKAALSEVFEQSLSSASFILMRLKSRGVQLHRDLSSTDEPQFSKCLNPDDLQMLSSRFNNNSQMLDVKR